MYDIYMRIRVFRGKGETEWQWSERVPQVLYEYERPYNGEIAHEMPRTPLVLDFWWFSPAEAGYGVATVSRVDTIIGLFCRILSLL